MGMMMMIHFLSVNNIMYNLLVLIGMVQPDGGRSLRLLCMLVPRQAEADFSPVDLLQGR